MSDMRAVTETEGTFRHRPHDKLFRYVFQDPEEVRQLLEAYLPDSVRRPVRWETLELNSGAFVDRFLGEWFADLLFDMEMMAGAEVRAGHILLEHQSTVDSRMPQRLLLYLNLVWARARTGACPLILPVVFYQGPGAWSRSVHLTDQFPDADREWMEVVTFRHRLIDQSGMAPEEIQGGPRGRIVQWLMMAAFHPDRRRAALELAARLMAEMPPQDADMRVFIEYVYYTQENEESLGLFQEAVSRHSRAVGESVMSYADILEARGREQGIALGEARGKKQGIALGEARGEARAEKAFLEHQLQTVDTMLGDGLEWPAIERYTAVSADRYEEMKRRLDNWTDPE